VAAVAAVIAGLVLLAPAPDLALIAANGALLVAAIVDWALTPRARRLQVERSVPGIVALDSEAEVVWKVRNPSRRRLRVRLADELVPSLGADSRRARLVLPPLGSATARTRLRPQRRGRFDPTTITLRVQGPLGLAARQGRVTVPGVLRVYPPFHSRDEAELRLSRSRVLQVGLRAAQGRGGGTEFDSLREYSVDDEFRRIDWAATARARKPIVRTYRAERNQTVLVLLDSGRTMAGRVEGVPRLDHAMDAVMMMTAVATRLGDRAGLVAFSDQVRGVVGPSSGRAQLSTVTESMYQLEPELVESDYRGAFVETLGRFRRRALLVVLTELAEQAIAQTLMPALPLVVRDHLVIVAAVRDPAVARWASAVPIEAGAAYRKAAAVQASEQRRLTVAKLRGLGAVVIDATPGRLAPELADAYLKVKSTGRI
jgi:uncharacterized protein (DUF58 family)